MRFSFWIQIVFLFFFSLPVSVDWVVSVHHVWSACNSISIIVNYKESHLKQKETTLKIQTFWLLKKKNRYAVTSKAEPMNLPLHFQLKRWRKSSFFFFPFSSLLLYACTAFDIMSKRERRKECTHGSIGVAFMWNESRKQSLNRVKWWISKI